MYILTRRADLKNTLKLYLIVFVALAAIWFCNTAGAAASASLHAGAATVRSIVFDQTGRMWIATFGRGLWLSDDSGLRNFHDQSTDLPPPMVNNLMAADDSLYVATAGAGCLKLSCSSLRFAPVNQLVGFEKLHALFKTSTGKILIGSVGSGTAVLRNDSWQPVSESQSSQLGWVNSIAEFNGKIWLGTATGLYNNSIELDPWKPQFAGLSRAINCLHVSRGILYAGTTDRGVYMLKPGSEPEPVAGTMGQMQFLIDFNGSTIAGGELGLWKIDEGQSQEINTELYDAKCAAVSQKKILFIGTMNGKIYRSVDAKQFETAVSILENSPGEQK